MLRCSTCHRRLLAGASCPAHPAAEVLDGGTADEPAAPPEVPGYTLQHRLGAGGFAQVFSASREADGEPVALKIALLPDDWRFAREADALSRVAEPFAPRLIEVGEAEGFPFIAMELIAGRSLADWLAAKTTLAPPRNEAINLLRSICATVDAIHGQSLIHRDLKPENLILHGRGITAIDFGLAREGTAPANPEEIQRGKRTLVGMRVGTPTYMAPEQCLGTPDVGFETDIYAVGVMAYELLCGRPPFVGASNEIQQGHVIGVPASPSSLVEVPKAVDAVMSRVLAKAPAERHSTAGQLFVELAGALEGRGRRHKKVPTPASAKPLARSRRGPMALLAIESEAPVARLREAAAIQDGELVRASGPWYVVAFARAVSLENGIRSALNVAARLEGLATRCVVHTARLRTKEGARGLLAMGSALERVSDWTPAASSGGARVLLTSEAADHFAETTRADAIEGYYSWASPVRAAAPELASRIAFRGRDELISALRAEGERSKEESIPTVSTVVGEAGSGKSRLLEELARATPAGERLVDLREAEADGGAGSSMLVKLLCFSLGVDGLRDRAALAARTRDLLGRRDDALLDALVALGEGAVGEAAAGMRPHLVARLLAEGLRRRGLEGRTTVLLDDAHLAEAVVLEALEQAVAMPGSALWVVATAGPELDSLRPGWGERATAAARHRLEPLPFEDARKVLLDLLTPAEFIPDPVVARLVELCRGLPLFLVEVARLLRAQGRIRRLRGTESFYVDADDLLRVSATPLAERLAERTLGSLPKPLVVLAQVSATLEKGIDADSVRAVAGGIPELDRLDPGVGLAQLARAGLLVPGDDGYRFRRALLCQAVRGTIPADRRRAFHAASVRFLERRTDLSAAERTRLAGHAAACGMRERAAAVYLDLGEQELQKLDGIAAERHFTAALGQLVEAPTLQRQRALAGRGRARLRIRDLAGGAEDLQGARAIAETCRESMALAEYLLEEATLRDRAFDFPEAQALASRAIEIAGDFRDPRLAARLEHAAGRARLRARPEQNREAVDLLTRAVALAREAGDRETEVEALVLLGPALAACDSFEEAERVYEEVIGLCEESGDIVHLGVAHANRAALWEARGLHERAVADLERARWCARTSGQAEIERAAEHSLAELRRR